MNKIGLSALLLACVAFILLPDVSQAETDENAEVVKKIEPVIVKLLKDSSVTKESKRYLRSLYSGIRLCLEIPERCRDEKYYQAYMDDVERLSEQEGLSDEANKNLQELIELLGQLS